MLNKTKFTMELCATACCVSEKLLTVEGFSLKKGKELLRIDTLLSASSGSQDREKEILGNGSDPLGGCEHNS